MYNDGASSNGYQTSNRMHFKTAKLLKIMGREYQKFLTKDRPYMAKIVNLKGHIKL